MDEVLIPLTFFIGTTMVLWKFFQGRHLERMEMIQRGVSPGDLSIKDIDKMGSILRSLKWGLLLLCGGTGFLVGYFIMESTGKNDDPSIMFGSTIVAGGIGLLVFYAVANKKSKTDSL